MTVFFHVDLRGEIRAGDVLTTLPVTSKKFPEDAAALNDLFPDGLSYFGSSVLLHMDEDSPDRIREEILETIRRQFQDKCAVDYPSRLSSLFACADLDAAKHFRDNYKRDSGKIWRVECDEHFCGDMNFVCHELIENHNMGVWYWQGKSKTANPLWEYLLRPPVKVLGEAEERDANVVREDP